MNTRAIHFLVWVFGVSAGVVVFSYSTFATKEEIKATVIERLDRIESKLDRLIEASRH
jgi:hypothetical protein